MTNLLFAVCTGFFALQNDTLSYQDTTTMWGAIQPDSLEPLVEQLEDAEESSVLDLVEEIFGEKEMPVLTVRSRLTRKLQPARAYLDDRYPGSSNKLYQRYKLAGGEHIVAGVLLEKDPGESKINDFTTAYLLTRGVGPVHAFILGDYIVEAGQGIALWRGYDFTKGAEVVLPVKRASRGLVPYASSNENSFLRGVATQIGWGDATLVAFYSRKSLSATLDTFGKVSSMYMAGYFRTQTEKEKRNVVTETVAGARGSYSLSDRNQIGFTGYVSTYSREFANPSLNGRRYTILSADYRLSVRSVSMFGEWSVNNSSVGGIAGLHAEPEKSFDIVMAFRAYPSSFLSIHNNGFGERSGTANERGWYFAARLRPLRRIRVSLYHDLFSFPEKTSTTFFSGSGHEIFVQGEVGPLPRLLITPRFRKKITVERKSTADEENRTIRFDDERRKDNYRITVDYRLNRTTSLRSRFEYTELEYRYLRRREHGKMLYSDVVVHPSGTVSLSGRVAVFHTDSFDSGIGEYERDVPGALSVPILYGKGVKWYLLVQISLLKSVRLSLKYSELIREDVKTIGSGLDEMLTNRDNRIALQIDGSW